MRAKKGKPSPWKRGLGVLKRAPKTEAAVGRYVHLGLTLGVSAVLFFYVGYQLDQRLGSLPWLTVLGTFLGAFGGFLYIYRELTAAERREPKDEEEEKTP